MRIKTITLKNFQSHKNTVIDLANGLNCITGSWHSGKSSLVRALNFFLYNDWHPSFNRFDSGATEIKLELEDGSIIERVKGENINKVIVNGTVFENFGNTLPAEAINLLGVEPLKIDIDQQVLLNVSQQDDGLFLLSERGPYRAKILNRVFGVFLIDAALRNLSKDKKQLMGNIQERQEKIKSLGKDLEPFGDLVIHKELLLKAEDLLKEIEAAQQQLQTLKVLHGKLKGNRDKLISLQKEEESLKADLEKQYTILSTIDNCPLCGKELEKGKAKDLIEGFK